MRWFIEGVSFVLVEGFAAFAFLIHRTDSATALFVSGLLVLVVELIYTMNRFAGSTAGGVSGSGWVRGNVLLGALLGWGFAFFLAALGLYHLVVP